MSFSNRHIGIDKESEKIMLDYLGVSDTETLIKETIPNEIRLKKDITLEVEMSEAQFLDHIYICVTFSSSSLGVIFFNF